MCTFGLFRRRVNRGKNNRTSFRIYMDKYFKIYLQMPLAFPVNDHTKLYKAVGTVLGLGGQKKFCANFFYITLPYKRNIIFFISISVIH